MLNLNFDQTLTSKFDPETKNTLLHEWASCKNVNILKRALQHEKDLIRKELEDQIFDKKKMLEE